MLDRPLTFSPLQACCTVSGRRVTFYGINQLQTSLCAGQNAVSILVKPKTDPILFHNKLATTVWAFAMKESKSFSEASTPSSKYTR